MNAAARIINQSNVFTGQWMDIRMSRDQSLLVALMCALLLTVIAIIYVTNESRSALSELERLQTQAHESRLERGQLLLEQAALSTPARVELLASKKLGMNIPADSKVSVLPIG